MILRTYLNQSKGEMPRSLHITIRVTKAACGRTIDA